MAPSVLQIAGLIGGGLAATAAARRAAARRKKFMLGSYWSVDNPWELWYQCLILYQGVAYNPLINSKKNGM